jgi:hypothetical protein
MVSRTPARRRKRSLAVSLILGSIRVDICQICGALVVPDTDDSLYGEARHRDWHSEQDAR